MSRRYTPLLVVILFLSCLILPLSQRNIVKGKCGALMFRHNFIRGLRLGNVLFQYASVYGIGRATKRTPIVFVNDTADAYPLHELFKLSNQLVAVRNAKHAPKFPQITMEGPCCVHNRKLEALPCNTGTIEVCCYLQSWKYFYPYLEELKDDLTFKDDIEERCTNALKDEANRFGLKRDKLFLVGIHVRAFSKEGASLVKYGHANANLTYIRLAMSFMREKAVSLQKTARFVVFSSNREDLMEVWKIRDDNNEAKIAVSRSWQMDFCMLTKTEGLITTVGTFGWWAAFLNSEAIVTRQAQHCVKGSQLCHEFNGEDASDFYLNGKWARF